jgi:hypothetical protein
VGGLALGLKGDSGGGCKCTVNSDLGAESDEAKWDKLLRWSRVVVNGLRVPASGDMDLVDVVGDVLRPCDVRERRGRDGSSSSSSSVSSSMGVMGGGGVNGVGGIKSAEGRGDVGLPD